MRLVFCKTNKQSNQIYYLPSVKKLRKATNKSDYELKDVSIIQDFLGRIDLLVSDVQYAQIFKNKFSAFWFMYWHCVNPTLKLIDLDNIEA